jgi:PTS system nitrogen regulatory IIA component
MKSRALQRLMTVDEVADYLQVRPSTIYQWTHQGFIPHVKLGNLVRFRLSQVDKWVERKEVDRKQQSRLKVL